MISAAIEGVAFGTLTGCLDTANRTKMVSVMERTIAARGVKIPVIHNRIDIFWVIWIFLRKLASPCANTKS